MGSAGDSPTGTSVVRRDKQIASYLQITSPTFRPAGRRPEQASGLCHPNRILRHGLSRNDAVESGEHTPLACGLRRRAANFSTTDVLHPTVGRFVRMKPAARRRRQHAGRMRSPFSTASFRLMEESAGFEVDWPIQPDGASIGCKRVGKPFRQANRCPHQIFVTFIPTRQTSSSNSRLRANRWISSSNSSNNCEGA